MMFCRAVNPALATAMELYAHRERADALADLDAPTRRLSETLAYMLILMTKDTALEKARNAPEPAHGLETWRLFNKEWEPQVPGRFGGMLIRILETPFPGQSDEEFEAWEALIKKYEDQSKDTLTDAVDVVPAKARSAAYYSRPGGPELADQWPGFPVDPVNGVAVTTTALAFLSQPFFPPGIDTSGVEGPLFPRTTLNQFPAQATLMGAAAPDPGYQNGLIFFPGAVPLYRGGVLVGALGVSGDGVENNDFIAAGGALGFEAPQAFRIDNFYFGGVRIPYLKFPTNP